MSISRHTPDFGYAKKSTTTQRKVVVHNLFIYLQIDYYILCSLKQRFQHQSWIMCQLLPIVHHYIYPSNHKVFPHEQDIFQTLFLSDCYSLLSEISTLDTQMQPILSYILLGNLVCLLESELIVSPFLSPLQNGVITLLSSAYIYPPASPSFFIPRISCEFICLTANDMCI